MAYSVIPMPPTALIAEDEPLLAAALAAELATAWPELQIAATVGDGASAVREALALQPDVLFFDIRMPGMNGLDAAVALSDEWRLDCPQPQSDSDAISRTKHRRCWTERACSILF